MATRKRTPKETTEAVVEASNEEVVEVTSEAVESDEQTMSFVEYIENNKPHYGLVASFKYEATKTENGLADRTEAQWTADFTEQSRKTYL